MALATSTVSDTNTVLPTNTALPTNTTSTTSTADTASATSTAPVINPLPVTESVAQPAVSEGESVQLLLTGMSCASCVSKVQNALQRVDGVQVARVNLAERSALVTGTQNNEALIAAVKNAGYARKLLKTKGSDASGNSKCRKPV